MLSKIKPHQPGHDLLRRRVPRGVADHQPGQDSGPQGPAHGRRRHLRQDLHQRRQARRRGRPRHLGRRARPRSSTRPRNSSTAYNAAELRRRLLGLRRLLLRRRQRHHQGHGQGAAAASPAINDQVRQDIIKAVQDTSIDGVTGKVAFDEFGDTTTKILTVYKVESGAWKSVEDRRVQEVPHRLTYPRGAGPLRPALTFAGGPVTQFLQQLVNGTVSGATYGLIALGYTMVYGIIQLINFAHGEIFMVGAFAGLDHVQVRAARLACRQRVDRAARSCSSAAIAGVGRSSPCSWSGSPTGRCATRPGWRRSSPPSACRSPAGGDAALLPRRPSASCRSPASSPGGTFTVGGVTIAWVSVVRRRRRRRADDRRCRRSCAAARLGKAMRATRRTPTRPGSWASTPTSIIVHHLHPRRRPGRRGRRDAGHALRPDRLPHRVHRRPQGVHRRRARRHRQHHRRRARRVRARHRGGAGHPVRAPRARPGRTCGRSWCSSSCSCSGRQGLLGEQVAAARERIGRPPSRRGSSTGCAGASPPGGPASPWSAPSWSSSARCRRGPRSPSGTRAR